MARAQITVMRRSEGAKVNNLVRFKGKQGNEVKYLSCSLKDKILIAWINLNRSELRGNAIVEAFSRKPFLVGFLYKTSIVS